MESENGVDAWVGELGWEDSFSRTTAAYIGEIPVTLKSFISAPCAHFSILVKKAS